MIPRKFVATTSREALYKVREALGDEAIILSNKQVPGGVEIIAVSEHEMDAFAHEAHTEPERRSKPASSAPAPAASFSSPQWPRYPEPGVGAAAHYQHWQNASWSSSDEEFDSAIPIMEESVLSSSHLNQYWQTNTPDPSSSRQTPLQTVQIPSAQYAPHSSAVREMESVLPWMKNLEAAPREPVRESREPIAAHKGQPSQPSNGTQQTGCTSAPVPRPDFYHASPVSHQGKSLDSTPESTRKNERIHSADIPRNTSFNANASPVLKPHSSSENSLSSSHSAMKTSGPSPSFHLEKNSSTAAGHPKEDQAIQHELKLLRSILEGQLAGFAWHELSQRSSLHLTLMRWLLSAGISPALSREILEGLPQVKDVMVAMNEVRHRLSQHIDCMPAHEDIIDKGGIYALVGTTGVGKTTTVAKLAARCTLKHGAQHVALLTTDSYRIGAHDQLKAYGRILSVPVYGIRDESDLVSALNDLSTRRLILIDTIGMSQRDRRLVEQIALLGRQGGKVQQLLLIAANAQASTLEDVVRAYGSSQLAGVVISKLDETAQIGAVLDILARHRLRLCYLTDGQRVPEDLHLPDAKTLVERAFQDIGTVSPLTLRDDEYPLVWK